MVFLLRHVEYGETLILGLNRTYTLGRSRRNDIHLTEVTVSNSHATLEISDISANIMDGESDYGTWVNKQRIHEPFTLRNGDVIVFGKNNCKYVFLDPKFEAIMDKNISKPTQLMLMQTLKELHIKLSETYSRTCTHYVVESVCLDTLKEKTILYNLIDRMNVITPKYFVDILANIKEAPLMPNIYRYMPEIDNKLKSKGVEDINPRKKRRHIFDNMVFVFFDKNQDRELSDLVLKCGGDCVLYSQKQNFFEELLKDMDKCKYVAVNHVGDQKKPPIMNSFLRTMKQKKKKVIEIGVVDLYVSILKGDLVDIQPGNEPDKSNPKEPQPSTSKNLPTVILDSSEDEESSSESEIIDIVSQIVKTPRIRKEPPPLNTFSRLAAAYKEQKTIAETVLHSHASSSTLNRWITRFKNNAIEGQNSDKTFVTNGNALKTNKRDDHRHNREANGLTDDESERGSEGNADNIRSSADIAKESSSTETRKKNAKKPREPEERVKDVSDVSPGESDKRNGLKERLRSKKNGKRKSIVVNPFAVVKTPKRFEEYQDCSSSTIEGWLKKYKNVDIIPMT